MSPFASGLLAAIVLALSLGAGFLLGHFLVWLDRPPESES